MTCVRAASEEEYGSRNKDNFAVASLRVFAHHKKKKKKRGKGVSSAAEWNTTGSQE